MTLRAIAKEMQTYAKRHPIYCGREDNGFRPEHVRRIELDGRRFVVGFTYWQTNRWMPVPCYRLTILECGFRRPHGVSVQKLVTLFFDQRRAAPPERPPRPRWDFGRLPHMVAYEQPVGVRRSCGRSTRSTKARQV